LRLLALALLHLGAALVALEAAALAACLVLAAALA
jgi:hypothetical protein